MSDTNFHFLEQEYPILFNLIQGAEYLLHDDPVTSLMKQRQYAERLTELLFEEHCLEFPYDNTFNNRLRELKFGGVLPHMINDLFHTIKHKGNLATHQMVGTVEDATGTLFSCFKVAKWYYGTYSGERKDISNVKFKTPHKLDTRHALHELEQQYQELEVKFNKLLTERDTSGLDQRQKAEINERSEQAASKLEMNEAETRVLIDAELKAAGWEVDTQTFNYKTNKTTPERGRNLAIAEWPCGGKWADYALFIGTDMYAIVEAKKYAHDISTDLGQSKVYAEKVEAKHEAKLLGEWFGYKVPFLFSTNGRPYLEQIKTKSGIWFLDVRKQRNNARALQGWYSPQGLKGLFTRDLTEANKKLKESSDFLREAAGLNLRSYQMEAIKAVEELLIEEKDQNRALLAMATGTGKTRTVIGLAYRLIQTNRFKRILFLIDRTLLGTQAFDAFTDNKVADLHTFSEIYDVKGLKEIQPDIDTRLHFATVQGMVKRLFYNDDENKPSVDQYDCIIIDEAHRGYLLDREIEEEDLHFKDQRDYVSKYRMVLDYFDVFAVGLTATPALHTSEIFGKPVYTYSYREAVIDGYLIDHEPPYLINTKLSEEGIKWEKGEKPKAYDQEKNEVIELDELEDELSLDIASFNKAVLTESFNRTVIQYLVNEIDPEGEEKTLVFAATDDHADDVVRIFKEEFKAIGVDLEDNAILKITGKAYDPEGYVKRYKNEKYPTIAVTVDLLTTGIDVPAICNLVFMRRIKSRILYEQMLGRATRRCDEIGKETFRIYDAVRIYEALEDYTQMRPVVSNPTLTFMDLIGEVKHIDNEERAKRQVEQIIAKIQRKRHQMNESDEDIFRFNSGDKDPESFIGMLRDQPPLESLKEITEMTGLWSFLDKLKLKRSATLVSDHEDEYRSTERGYGKGVKPKDYLKSFERFIRDNQNKIMALNIVCTRPKELDRKSLKELMIALDQEGYNETALNAAWKEIKNEDIAADIISFIRTLAIGSSLVSHEDRIKGAVNKIRSMKSWNRIQQKWIDRIEMQLIKESVLQVEDLDDSLFADAGGFKRLNKIFDNELKDLIVQINNGLYDETA